MSKQFKNFLIFAIIIFILLIIAIPLSNLYPTQAIEIGRILLGALLIAISLFGFEVMVVNYNSKGIFKKSQYAFLNKIGYSLWGLGLALFGGAIILNVISYSAIAIFLILIGLGVSTTSLRGILTKELYYGRRFSSPRYYKGKDAVVRARLNLLKGISVSLFGIICLIVLQ